MNNRNNNNNNNNNNKKKKNNSMSNCNTGLNTSSEILSINTNTVLQNSLPTCVGKNERKNNNNNSTNSKNNNRANSSDTGADEKKDETSTGNGEAKSNAVRNDFILLDNGSVGLKQEAAQKWKEQMTNHLLCLLILIESASPQMISNLISNNSFTNSVSSDSTPIVTTTNTNSNNNNKNNNNNNNNSANASNFSREYNENRERIYEWLREVFESFFRSHGILAYNKIVDNIFDILIQNGYDTIDPICKITNKDLIEIGIQQQNYRKRLLNKIYKLFPYWRVITLAEFESYDDKQKDLYKRLTDTFTDENDLNHFKYGIRYFFLLQNNDLHCVEDVLVLNQRDLEAIGIDVPSHQRLVQGCAFRFSNNINHNFANNNNNSSSDNNGGSQVCIYVLLDQSLTQLCLLV